MATSKEESVKQLVNVEREIELIKTQIEAIELGVADDRLTPREKQGLASKQDELEKVLKRLTFIRNRLKRGRPVAGSPSKNASTKVEEYSLRQISKASQWL